MCNMKSISQTLFIHGFLFSFSIFTFLCFATTDSLSSGQSLTLNQTLISEGGNFELGFFKPGDSLRYYLGIWYKKISIKNKTYVWVANRDAPLTDPSSAELKLLKDGNLVLYDHSKLAVWSTTTNIKTMNSSEAVLGKDGNLILRYGLDASDVYWQSFDYPSDTWLPGGRFGYDNRSTKSLSLTSWRSPNDPSLGLFSINLDPVEIQWIMKWNQTQTYWSSGPWNGEIFIGVPEMILNKGIFETRYVKTTNRSYFTISVVNPSLVARFVMDFTGQVKTLIWDDTTQQWFPIWSRPTKQCEVFSFCGAFAVCNRNGLPLCECMDGFQPRSPESWNMSNFRGGCVSKSYLQCGRTFSLFSNVTFPVNQYSVDVASSDDCKLICLNNCSCSAYAYRSTRCSIVIGDLSIVPQSYGGSDLYIRIPISEKQSSGGKHKNAITGGVVGGIGVLIVSVLIYTWLKKRKNCEGKLLGDNSTEWTTKDNSELPLFDLVTIAASTNEFSASNKIGEGGFGPVYKGVLPTGEEIAVKRFSKSSSQGLQEFMNEVLLIAKLQHRNLVRLLGSCIEGDERMLIYEYMPNKSLDYFIFDTTRSINLSWEKRVGIIVGIARGLLYLHRDSQLRIIHRDLKAANILLDSQMNPKISDFGIARPFKGDQIEENTLRVVGTYGYMSPEYATDGNFSMKSDVFSFGVLVLEIVTGERNRRFNHADHDLNLLGHAWNLLNGGKALELVDPSIKDSTTEAEALKCIHVGLLCVQKNPDDRPAMSSVLSILDGEGTMLPWPKQPGFYEERSAPEGDSSSSRATVSTKNEETITLPWGLEMKARKPRSVAEFKQDYGEECSTVESNMNTVGLKLPLGDIKP